jgi:hypothetical protein
MFTVYCPWTILVLPINTIDTASYCIELFGKQMQLYNGTSREWLIVWCMRFNAIFNKISNNKMIRVHPTFQYAIQRKLG